MRTKELIEYAECYNEKSICAGKDCPFHHKGDDCIYSLIKALKDKLKKKAKGNIRCYIGGALMCFGFLLILGAAGLSDQGASFADTLIQVAIGGCIAIAGLAVGY